MTQDTQLTREQLRTRQRNCGRATIASVVGIGIGLAGILYTPSYYLSNKPKEIVQYENARQTYYNLLSEKSQLERPKLPYENEAIQKYFNVKQSQDEIRAKPLEDATESTEAEMNIHSEAYSNYISELNKIYYSSIGLTLLSLLGFMSSTKKATNYFVKGSKLDMEASKK